MPPKQRLTTDLEEKLATLFFDDTLQGLANPKQLQSYAKQNNILITQAVAKEFIEKQASAQRFTRLKTESLCTNYCKKMDLPNTLTIERKYIIVLFEITSRKVYSRVVKDRTAKSASEAMKDMIQQMKSEGNDIDTYI